MAWKESTPSRDKIVRTLLWVTAICTAGLGAGFLLGMVAIGQGLAIDGDNPPSFSHLSADPDAHLQATGIDAAGRKQYRYHPFWNLVRNQTKYYKLLMFSEALPALREQVEHELRKRGFFLSKAIGIAPEC